MNDQKIKIPELPNSLKGDWNDFNKVKEFDINHKFFKRDFWIEKKWRILHDWLSEYMIDTQDKKIIDVSCGSGPTLEIMRYFGYEIMGVDFHGSYNTSPYQPLLDSQKIPCIIHDCRNTPFPFKDRQFDVLINEGAMSFYKVRKDISMWYDIVNEFFRITNETIFLSVNFGWGLDEGRKYQSSEDNKKEWTLIKQFDNIYKWKRNEEN